MLRKPRQISQLPGVYVFRKGATPLYVGKAANLKQRLASYFQKRAQLPIKIQRMLGEATRVETIETPSEVEALIKEAELIKKYRPKYNLLMRDDKSYFYVAISREQFPRIFVTHQPREKSTNSESTTNIRIRKFARDSLFADERRRLETRAPRFIGPFTSGTALKTVLKLLRRIFPYCTCKQPHRRPCLNAEIGRCPGYCCAIATQSAKRKAQSARSEYRKGIRDIVAVLSGERTRLTGRLKREMKEAVRRERYEEAARLRDAVLGLEDVFAHRQVLHVPEAHSPWSVVLGRLQSLLKTRRDITRIEGYDISNISGTSATGSMVVFANGQPDKSQYRKFRIRTVAGSNDVAMLKEVLARRFGHHEWPYAELIVVDGGKGQLNAALGALHKSKIPACAEAPAGRQNPKSKMPMVAALAKREEILHLPGRNIHLQRQDPAVLHLFQRIRDESHRFARAYHLKLRAQTFTPSLLKSDFNRQ